jgi:DNA-binding NarL/FixJ family response regulator
MREQVGAPVEAVDRAAYERGLTLVRAALSPEAFAAAWAGGASLSFAAAVAEAYAGGGPDGAPGSASDAPVPVAAAGLTVREGEVLRLLCEGLTDREIAAELHLSPRTVGVHVTHLLAKLGVGTRTAAVAAALRRGLT